MREKEFFWVPFFSSIIVKLLEVLGLCKCYFFVVRFASTRLSQGRTDFLCRHMICIHTHARIVVFS